MSLRSFLDQEVDVVDAQRSQLLVRALEVKQESTKGNIDLTVSFLSANRASLLSTPFPLHPPPLPQSKIIVNMADTHIFSPSPSSNLYTLPQQT